MKAWQPARCRQCIGAIYRSLYRDRYGEPWWQWHNVDQFRRIVRERIARARGREGRQ